MPKMITEWEKEFTNQFPGVNLLSEIELNREEYDSLAEEVRSVVARTKNLREATRRLEKHYPLSFVVFLAHFAARNTRGEFWETLGETIGAVAMDLGNAGWRKLFIDILKRNKKPTFEDVGGRTKKYVTSMRIHGGIPDYSLNDFFRNMLLPGVEKNQYAGLPPEALLIKLLQRTDVLVFTDSPVRNFFENSGEIGLAFLSECLRMARAYKKDGDVPADLQLPAYVPEKFIDFMEKQVQYDTRLKSPRLLFYPEGHGLVLNLPQQVLSAKDLRGNTQVFWQISWDGLPEPVIKQIRPSRSGKDIVTRTDQQVIPAPVRHVSVSFGMQSETGLNILRRWNLAFLPGVGQPSLLVFEPGKEDFCTTKRAFNLLEPKPYLFLTPLDGRLEFDGEARFPPDLEPLRGAWSSWKQELIGLEQVSQVRFVQPGKENIILRVATHLDSARLAGGELFETADPEEVPLYLGRPPRLLLPRHPGQSWTIRLQSAGPTIPSLGQDLTERDLNPVEDGWELDLEMLLGDEPAGTYIIKLSDHQEIDDELRFRIWPKLRLKDFQEIILPAFTDEKITFGVSLPTNAVLETQGTIDEIEIKGQYGQYVITLSHSIPQAKLNLVLPGEPDQPPAVVPLFIALPYLNWTFSLSGDELEEATIKAAQRSVDSFLDVLRKNQVSILFNMPGISRIVRRLEFALLDPENPDKPLHRIDAERKLLGDNHLRYSLNSTFDDLRTHPDLSVFTFELRLYDEKGIRARVNILSLTRGLEISDVGLEQQEGLNYRLYWQEAVALRNRRVFLYPSWQPWNSGVEFKIPDDANGLLHIRDVGLLPSDYQVYFYIAPPRQEARISLPENDHFHIQTISPQEQLATLVNRIQRNPRSAFQAHFESACIYESLNDRDRRDPEIEASIAAIEQANYSILTSFHDWVEQHAVYFQKAVRSKMLLPERLKEVYVKTQPDSPIRQTYLQHAQFRMLDSKSAEVILEHENDPQLVLFCLRLLLERAEEAGVSAILKKMKSGHLSLCDAVDLLSEAIDQNLEVLCKMENNPDTTKVIAAMLQRHPNQETAIQALCTSALVSLMDLKDDLQAERTYLRHLIQRGERVSIERIFELFDRGELRGDEVSELLGANPVFTYTVLSSLHPKPSVTSQLNVLATKYAHQLGIQPPSAAPNLAKPFTRPVKVGPIPKLTELINKEDKTGILQVMSFLDQGKLSEEQASELLALNPGLAHHTLLESKNFLKFQKFIIALARKYPLETHHIIPGMSVKTPGGWGIVDKIQGPDKLFDIALDNEENVSLKLALHSEINPEVAELDLGKNVLSFPGKSIIFQCQYCKEFISSNRDILEEHQIRDHQKKVIQIREHVPLLPVYRPFSYKPAPANSRVDPQAARENTSLLIASLPNKHLLGLATAEASSKAVMRACLGILIQREQEVAINFLLKCLENNHLSEEDGLALMGKNPEFAYSHLERLPTNKRWEMLLYALISEYPEETGHIKPGMHIKTPAGLANIISIQDYEGKIVKITPVDAPNLKLELTLHPETHPESAHADMAHGRLIFPRADAVYRCNVCQNIISADLGFITGWHTKRDHPGSLPVPVKQAPSVPFQRIEEFFKP